MNKKTFILTLVFCALTLAAGAQDKCRINGIDYRLDNALSTATVVQRIPAQKRFGTANIIIPEEVVYNHQEYTVTEIGERAFYGYEDVTSITLPSSIERVGREAFAYTGGMLGCVIRFDCPPPIYGQGAYKENHASYGFHFDFDARYEDDFLRNSTQLNEDNEPVDEDEETLPDDYWDGWDDVDGEGRPRPRPVPDPYKGKKGYAGKSFSNLLIPNNAIWYRTKNNTPLTVTHPENFPSMVDSLVSYDRQDKKEGRVVARYGLTYVPEAAFAGLRELTDVIVNSNVSEIHPAAFYGCYSLKDIRMKKEDYSQSPDSVTLIKTIGDSAFMNCTGLQSVRWAQKVTTIGAKCFKNCSALARVPFFNNVQIISDEAFAGTAVPNLNVSKPVYIGFGAFRNCHQLTSVKLPSVLYIGEDAFSLCDRLTSADVPAATIVDRHAFYQCTALTELNLAAADTIGEQAFGNCTSLKKITLPQARTLGAQTFLNCNLLTTITFGDRLVTIPVGMCENCTSLSDVQATHIGIVSSRAFYGCKNLKTINLSQATDIRSQAFANTGLEKLELGTNLLTIGDSAFAGCSKINAIHCRSIVPPVLGAGALKDVPTKDIILYVPRGTAELYRSSDWGKYIWKSICSDLDMTITADIYCNDTVVLTYSLTGLMSQVRQALQFTSSDITKAKVDNGKVIALRETEDVAITASIPGTIYAKTIHFRILPKPQPKQLYPVITRQSEGGKVISDVDKAGKGEWVDVSVMPNDTYMIDSVAAQSDTVNFTRPVELYVNEQDYTQFRFAMTEPYVAIGARFVQPQELFLNENTNHVADYTNHYGQVMNVTIGRSFVPDKVYTLALPFDLPTLVGTPFEGCTLAHVTYATRDFQNGLQVRFSTEPQGMDTCSAIHAGHPYLLKVNKTIKNPKFEYVRISDINGQNDTIPNMMVFHGLTSPQWIPHDSSYLFVYGSQLDCPSRAGNIRAFRAFFTLMNEKDYSLRPAYWIMEDGLNWNGEGEENGITLELELNTPEIVDGLNEITKPTVSCFKYLKSGQIVIYRNGRHYTLHGRLIR